jgi:hypothetical protein
MRENKGFEWRFKQKKQNKLREKKRGGWWQQRWDEERPKYLREEFWGAKNTTRTNQNLPRPISNTLGKFYTKILTLRLGFLRDFSKVDKKWG